MDDPAPPPNEKALVNFGAAALAAGAEVVVLALVKTGEAVGVPPNEKALVLVVGEATLNEKSEFVRRSCPGCCCSVPVKSD